MDILDLLMPGGQPIGAAGSRPSIREVKGSLQDAEKLFQQLTAGGTPVSDPKYSGTLTELPAGGAIGLRTKGTGRMKAVATIDVNIPDCPIRKIKFNP